MLIMHLGQLLGQEILKSRVAVNFVKYAAFRISLAAILVLNEDRRKEAQALQGWVIIYGMLEQFENGVDGLLRAQVPFQSHYAVRVLKDFNLWGVRKNGDFDKSFFDLNVHLFVVFVQDRCRRYVYCEN